MTSQNIGELPADFDLESYAFQIPQEQIAQHPPKQRTSSRLLVLDRGSGQVRHDRFERIAELLPEESVLVTNVTKVIPARVPGRKSTTNGKVEFLLLTPLPAIAVQERTGGWREAVVEGLLKPAKGLRPGSEVVIGDRFKLEVVEVLDFGRSMVRMMWHGELAQVLTRYGHLPLPPYIRREPEASDAERYQTVYAQDSKAGSVAAPTAGLHFSARQIEILRQRGHLFAEIALYVGYGTFSPIRVRDVREHRIHSEYMEIPEEAARTVSRARDHGRPVVAVGTTAVRALESVYTQAGGVRPFAGWTDLYMYPGYTFQVVDHLITNFHLPRSSLMLLVSAFAGRERILGAYTQAVEQGYRFFSYGDAMLIL